MRTVADVERAVRIVGGHVIGTDESGPYLGAFATIPGDGWDVAKVLERLSDEDSRDPVIVSLAESFRAQHPGAADLARELHAFVRDRVKFVPESVETFQSARFTLYERKAGDCDDSARALFALARAAGLNVRLAYLAKRGQPAHVFSQIAHDGAWHHAETTVAAFYDEHPMHAARRLGVVRGRTDLNGDVVTLNGLLTSDTLQIAKGERLRMTLLMQKAEALAGPDPRAFVRSALEDTGFDVASVFVEASELPPDWPAGQRSVTTGFPQWVAWAEASWGLDDFAVPRTNPDFVVQAAEFLGAGAAGPRTGPAAPVVQATKDLDDAFFRALVAGARAWGVDAVALAAVLFSESGIRANANNHGFALGINQFSTVGHPSVFERAVPGVSPADYLAFPASRQIAFVLRFWEGLVRWRGHFRTAGDLYWMNFLPASYPGPNAPDLAVVTADAHLVLDNLALVHPSDAVAKEALAAAREKRAAGEPLASGEAGVIRARGLAHFLAVAQAGNPSRWREIVARIQAAGGGASPVGGAVAVALVVGAGAAFARWKGWL